MLSLFVGLVFLVFLFLEDLLYCPPGIFATYEDFFQMFQFLVDGLWCGT